MIERLLEILHFIYQVLKYASMNNATYHFEENYSQFIVHTAIIVLILAIFFFSFQICKTRHRRFLHYLRTQFPFYIAAA